MAQWDHFCGGGQLVFFRKSFYRCEARPFGDPWFAYARNGLGGKSEIHFKPSILYPDNLFHSKDDHFLGSEAHHFVMESEELRADGSTFEYAEVYLSRHAGRELDVTQFAENADTTLNEQWGKPTLSESGGGGWVSNDATVCLKLKKVVC